MEITIINEHYSFTTMPCPSGISSEAWKYFCTKVVSKSIQYFSKECKRVGSDSNTQVFIHVVSEKNNYQNLVLGIRLDASYSIENIFDVSLELFGDVIKKITNELEVIKNEMKRFSGYFEILQPERKVNPLSDTLKKLEDRVQRIENYLSKNFAAEGDGVGGFYQTLDERLLQIEGTISELSATPKTKRRGVRK